jgi:hypothetical protein
MMAQPLENRCLAPHLRSHKSRETALVDVILLDVYNKLEKV